MKAVHVKIHGIVQGVWFRASTKAQADRCGVSGWVRNDFDGSVEAFFQGPDEAVERVLQWCRQGPAGAVVERVDVENAQPQGFTTGFSVRR